MILRTILSGAFASGEVQRRVDDADMAEGLREVAKHAARVRIIFLRQQSDVVLQFKQPVEKLSRFLITAEQNIDVGKPEAAGEENALARRQSIVNRLGPIPEHEPVMKQALLDLREGVEATRRMVQERCKAASELRFDRQTLLIGASPGRGR